MREESNDIHGTARIEIREGKLEEFERLAAQCVEIVRTKDTGTLEYDLLLNADGTECFVHERYRDSAAGIEHMANIGPLMKPLSEICTMTGQVCGTPSPESLDCEVESCSPSTPPSYARPRRCTTRGVVMAVMPTP